MNNLNKKVIKAIKWSSFGEIIAKIVVPITNMVIARVLSPEEFGIIATVTMIISFADIISDSGFQKYIIQHKFNSDKEFFDNINVAFWTNLLISFFLWGFICIFSNSIARLVGNPELGIAIILSGISLPVTSFSSIQIGIYKRYLDFKTLFYARIIGVVIPITITIPLALLGFSYWSLIIGTIIGNLVNATILTVKSAWKPSFHYNLNLLKCMFSFSVISLLESILSWTTSYVGTFIVANILNNYYLGLYKTTITTVNGIFAVITVSTTSVLFSSLSKLQDYEDESKKVYLSFIKGIAFIIFPMGAGIFMYKDLVTNILLGDQWGEAIPFVGIYALMSSITLVFAQYCSEFYRAKGKPNISVFIQVSHLFFLIPTIFIASKSNFMILSYATSIVKIQLILANILVLYFVYNIKPINMLRNIWVSLISSILMMGFSSILKIIDSGVVWSIISIVLCVIFYFFVMFLIPTGKKEIKNIIKFINIPIFNKIVNSLNKSLF